MEHMSKDLTRPQYLDSSVQLDSFEAEADGEAAEVSARTLMETSASRVCFLNYGFYIKNFLEILTSLPPASTGWVRST